MNEAFVIMRIGSPELDKIWREVYIPAIKDCGLEPRRVDIHNEGRLLNSEIADFIKRATILISDLTDERPNCYLEIGYAMGLGKFSNLILCANKDSKIHFDLSGYETLRWERDKLDQFKNDLNKKIKYRLKIIKDGINEDAEGKKEIGEWLANERKSALKGFMETNKNDAYFEYVLQPLQKKIHEKEELENIAKEAECHNTGWPIGVVLDRKEFKPRRHSDGIRAIINSRRHYDYWMLRTTGHFYFLREIEAKDEEKDAVYFDTRIWRIAEIFTYAVRLYKQFGLESDDRILINIRHSGLKGKHLASSNLMRHLSMGYYFDTADDVEYKIEDSLGHISENIKQYVYEVAKDLYWYCHFSIAKEVVDQIVDEFMKSRL